MAPNDKKSSTGTNDHDHEGQDPLSTNAQDQTFLKALQDLIVRVVDPKQMNDINQISLGPEAGKLITALHEFVVSIVGHSEPMTHNTVVEVSLVEENNTPQNEHNDDGVVATLPTTFSAKLRRDAVRDNDSDSSLQSLDSSENPQLTFHMKFLKGLNAHIFNRVPIRMLSFEPHGSSLQISLLERGAIYGRLELELREKMHRKDHIPIFTEEGRMETEEEAIQRLICKYARYAILSHTWLRTSGEVTYSDWIKGLFHAGNPGYHKLVNFCKVAWKDHGLTLGWMDTVCINKESSSELDESIRSMFNWYSRAEVCIIYLAETETISNMHIDRWFTRGWTLQELLAPSFIRFYNNNWKRFTEAHIMHDDKINVKVTEQIRQATTISQYELSFMHHMPISRRMQLAANREVTREEDIAYSLMGLFGVSISTAYGEGGERAFFRLLREILASSQYVMDILNWAGNLPTFRSHTSRILPSSPLSYLKSDPHGLDKGWPLEPLTLTHLGLRVPVILMSAIWIPGSGTASLTYDPIGDYGATVDLSLIGHWHNSPNGTYYLLQNRISGRDIDGDIDNGKYQLTLAVFNISGDAAAISIQKRCFAKVLYFHTSDVGKAISSAEISVIHTEEPVVFHLSNATIKRNSEDDIDNYTISRDGLTKHGMQLVNLYL